MKQINIEQDCLSIEDKQFAKTMHTGALHVTLTRMHALSSHCLRIENLKSLTQHSLQTDTTGHISTPHSLAVG